MSEIQPVKTFLKDGTELVIRHGVESDAPGLLKCVQEYLLDNEGMSMEADEFQKTEEQESEWIKGMRENPSEILLLAVVDGKIVGNVDFHIGKRKRLAHAGEFGMGLLKEWRSKGVGSALLGELIRWAESNPRIEKINLRVLATNQRAIGLYKKLGFKEEGRRAREIKYSDGTYADDLTMARFIEHA